jgi:hypothetical protein
VKKETKHKNQKKEETRLDKWKYLDQGVTGAVFRYGMSLTLLVELHALRLMKSGHCYAFSDLACGLSWGLMP